MSRKSSRARASRPNPADVEAIVDILTALEYGKKKEDTELVDAAFNRFHITRRPTKLEVAPRIATSPGFERFFLGIVDEVRPFARMLADV